MFDTCHELCLFKFESAICLSIILCNIISQQTCAGWSWRRLLMILTNSPTVTWSGMRNLVLSRTGNCFSPENLSMMQGTLLGCSVLICSTSFTLRAAKRSQLFLKRRKSLTLSQVLVKLVKREEKSPLNASCVVKFNVNIIYHRSLFSP